MKLTQKIIAAVHYDFGSKVRATLEISPAEFQEKIFNAGRFSKEDFDKLVELHKKYPGLVGLRTSKLAVGSIIATILLNGRNTKVVSSGEGEVYYPANLGFGSLFASDGKPAKNWSVVLSAFSTVEEAIEAYPELKPTFEDLFGKVIV